MPYSIQIRGHRQYRAQVRRNGLYRSKTFDALQDAQQWRRVTDGLLSGYQMKEILVTSLSAKVNTITNGLFLPTSVAVDSMGNLFIADTFNSVVKESLAH